MRRIVKHSKIIGGLVPESDLELLRKFHPLPDDDPDDEEEERHAAAPAGDFVTRAAALCATTAGAGCFSAREYDAPRKSNGRPRNLPRHVGRRGKIRKTRGTIQNSTESSRFVQWNEKLRGADSDAAKKANDDAAEAAQAEKDRQAAADMELSPESEERLTGILQDMAGDSAAIRELLNGSRTRPPDKVCNDLAWSMGRILV